MAASLLGTIEEYLSGDIVQRIGAFIGESPANTEKAVQSAAPAILGGLIQQASTPNGAEQLLGVITNAMQSVPTEGLAGLLASGASMEQAASAGQPLLSNLFGEKLTALTDLISSSSGIRPSSASTLLSLLTPLILTIVGREATARGNGAAGLMSLLTSQKAEIMSFLPSSLSSLVTGLGAIGTGAAGIGALARGAGTSSGNLGPQLTDMSNRVGASIGRAADDAGFAISNVGASIGAAGARASDAIGEVTGQAASLAKSGVDSLDEVSTSSRPNGWLLPALAIALLALGAWYFLGVRGGPGESTSLTATTATTPAATPPASNASSAATPGTGGGTASAATTSAAHAASDTSKSTAQKTIDASKTAASKTAGVTRDVAAKTKEVSKDVAGRTATASREVADKTKTVSKDVANKTAGVTKDAARATAGTTKKVGEVTTEKAEDAMGAVAGAFNKLTGRGDEKAEPVALPDGKTVKLTEGTANYQLAKYLEATDSTPKTFVFERLHFETGTTKLTRGSRGTMKNLGAILKAYPSVDVTLEGHTDNTGDRAKNQALAQSRAEAIKASLVKTGVAPSRVSTAGVGADKPIASNETPDGRQQNRRIELVVTKR